MDDATRAKLTRMRKQTVKSGRATASRADERVDSNSYELNREKAAR
jgi:hypothetical protein